MIKHYFSLKKSSLKKLKLSNPVLLYSLLFSKLQDYHVVKDLSDIEFCEHAVQFFSVFCSLK